MMNRLPGRLRLGFSSVAADESEPTVGTDHVEFVAYGEDCILSGRAVLDADRLSDMLNDHDEYLVSGLSVTRFDDPSPFELDDEIAIPRDEIYLVHASGPRGDAARRHRTTPQHLAVKVGPYKVRGFFHALPGADPVVAFRRRKAMVPLTDARIEFTLHGEPQQVTVGTLIVNREQVDWVQTMLPSEADFPERASGLAASAV
jgi:hypothetical protein